MVALESLCEVCGEKPAVAECSVCGRRVCSGHSSEDPSGRVVCVVCKSALCALCRERLSVAYCLSCGRMICMDCSVQLDNVRRICLDCARRGVKPKPRPKLLRGASRLALRVLGLLAG